MKDIDPPEFRDSPPELQRQLKSALRDASLRVGRLEQAGKLYWVKKEEKLGLRMRLQKGNPHRAFEADRTGLLRMSERGGVPTPRLVDEGENYFVTEDAGTPLSLMLQNPLEFDGDERIAAFAAAGRVLAETHAKQLSHGRPPSVKDMCWRDGHLTLLDFERYSPPARNTDKGGHMRDLVVFVHSTFSFAGEERPEISAAIDAYRSADKRGIWGGKAQTFCRRIRWVDWVTKPIQWRKPGGRAREFKAIPATLKAFGVF